MSTTAFEFLVTAECTSLNSTLILRWLFPSVVESDQMSAELHLPVLLQEIATNERTLSKNDDQRSLDIATFLPQTRGKNRAARISWRHKAPVEVTKHKERPSLLQITLMDRSFKRLRRLIERSSRRETQSNGSTRLFSLYRSVRSSLVSPCEQDISTQSSRSSRNDQSDERRRMPSRKRSMNNEERRFRGGEKKEALMNN